jgi:hypothetical protein
VDDSGGDIRKSSKLPAQEYGGGIIVLACKDKTRHCHVLVQQVVSFFPQVNYLDSYAIMLDSNENNRSNQFYRFQTPQQHMG